MHPTWHKVTDPGTGWKASKTTWATADSFSAGLEVTFSEMPAGTKAVICAILNTNTLSGLYTRAGGDTNISNTPEASSEYSAIVGLSGAVNLVSTIVQLNSSLQAQFTVANTGTDTFVSYPRMYLL